MIAKLIKVNLNLHAYILVKYLHIIRTSKNSYIYNVTRQYIRHYAIIYNDIYCMCVHIIK